MPIGSFSARIMNTDGTLSETRLRFFVCKTREGETYFSQDSSRAYKFETNDEASDAAAAMADQLEKAQVEHGLIAAQ